MERLKKILIQPGFTIKQALMHMDAMGQKTLLVTDDSQRLLGTVTDGDIRSWILDGKSLDKPVASVMHRKPMFLPENEYSAEMANKLMLRHEIECLPVLDECRKVVSAVWWVDLVEHKPRPKKQISLPVVIMAGGAGSRLLPFTKILPKPLIPLGDKPIIEIIMEKFAGYGCREFYISVHYKSSLVKAFISELNLPDKVRFVQESKPLGTAGSLGLLHKKVDSPFFVSNCDILIEADYSDMLRFHQKEKNVITLVGSIKNFTIPYGICEIINGGTLKSIREKPEYDFLVNTGMYVLEPEVISDIPRDKRYDFTDLISDYLRRKKKIGVYPISDKSWIDIGQYELLQKTIKNIEEAR